MPSVMTHAYFALDVYDKLDAKAKKKLAKNKEQLKTFALGPDPFYAYYYINFKAAKKIRELGAFVHRHNSKDFFINLITYIKKEKLENKGDVIAFLYGFISHYVLDTTIHPYVFYKTGIFNPKKPDTYKYNALHKEMEMYLDAYMIYTKESILPKDFKVHHFAFNVTNFSKALEKTINYVFNETFGKEKVAKIYLKSIQLMKKGFYVFKYDPLGIKRKLYRVIDKITTASTLKQESMSYHIHHKEKSYYLNLDKNKWHDPVEGTDSFDLSFIELYRIGIEKTLFIINKVNEVLYQDKEITILDEVFTNLSYVTGKPCEERQKLQCFEF